MLTRIEPLFELIPDALILVDAEGRIIKANRCAHALFAADDETLPGDSIETLLPAGLRTTHAAHREAYTRAPRVRPMGAQHQVLVGLRRDGRVFPVEIALGPLHTDTATYFLASIRDVSASERVRQSEAHARYDSLVAKVAEHAVKASDVMSVLLPLPQAVATALEIDLVAILADGSRGGSWHVQAETGLAPLTLASLPAWIRAVARPESIITLEDVRSWSDADSAPCTSAAALRAAGVRTLLSVPLLDRGGQIGALVIGARKAVVFDAAVRHCLASVAGVLSALMQRVRTEERLAHAQRLEAIGRLTGGIAHDFNNLLTVVSGNLQLAALQCPRQPAVKRLLAQAQRAVDSAADLTGKLLSFARRQHLQPQRVDLEALLTDLVELLKRTLGSSIAIALRVAAGLPVLFIDRAQLEAALLNLALNARDALHAGGQILIEARALELAPEEARREDLRPGQFLALSVTDNGSGIPAELLEHVFEPFFSTKPAGEGNGLGLSMVYGFARQSGGNVRVESEPGKGTRIELLLPAPATVPCPEDTPEPAQTSNEDVPGGSERILLVEDDTAVAAVTRAFLKSLGYTVEGLDSAERALQRLQDAPPIDCLLSDVMLGQGCSGLELARAASALRPGLKVLLMSGYEHDSELRSAPESRALPLLRKPFRREQLARWLRQQLDAGPPRPLPTARSRRPRR